MLERERRGIDDSDFRPLESFAVLKRREMWLDVQEEVGLFVCFAFGRGDQSLFVRQCLLKKNLQF